MGRLIGIDYGRKRTGLAVTDPLRIIANSLTTVPSEQVLEYLRSYVSREPVDGFVIGYPRQMNNLPSESVTAQPTEPVPISRPML